MVDKKKCENCGAPLEGFLFNTVGKLFGIKQSETNEKICNKCEEDSKKEDSTTKVADESNEETSEEDTESEQQTLANEKVEEKVDNDGKED
jgi:hypothetical protein